MPALVYDTSVTTINREVTQFYTSGSGKGQVSSVTYFQGNGSLSLQEKELFYDNLGRLEETRTRTGGSEWSERTTYNRDGRVFQQFDASGFDHGIRYHYKNGHVFQLQEARDGPSGTVYQQVEHTDAYGNITEALLGNGVTTLASYKPDSGHLDQLTATRGGTTLQNVDYLFDVLGNLKHRHDFSSGNNKETFSYDALNRLTTVSLAMNGVNYGATTNLSYFDNGNIQSKTGLAGNYQYNAAQPHAVSRAGGISYSYDANGNNTSSTDGRQISYTVFDKADLITKGNYRTQFDYGIGHSRYRRVDESKTPSTGFSADKITTYLGTVEYIEDLDSDESYYLRRIGGAALQRFYPGTQVRQTRYLLKDHLGSIHTVLSDTGNVDERMHFGAFGERMEALDWQVPASPARAAMLNAITTRGFTGHEHADRLGIIQMGGRIYDPRLGRFLQADPFVQAPKNSQNLNRYSYVLNNPLSYTDPSGYFFSKLWDKIRPFVAIAISIVGTIFAPYLAPLWGALSGYVATGTARGAFAGFFAGAVFSAIGTEFANLAANSATGALSTGQTLAKIAAHGFAGGASSVIGGGDFGHGFVAAGFAQAFAGPIGRIDSANVGVSVQRTLAAAVVGGTAAELSGGKFANGAVTGAFSRAFNDEVHKSSLFRNIDEDPSLLTKKLLSQRIDLLRAEVKRYRESVRLMSPDDFADHTGQPGLDSTLARGVRGELGRELYRLQIALDARSYSRSMDSAVQIASELAIGKGSGILMKRLGIAATRFELAPIQAPSSRVMFQRAPTMQCVDSAICGVVWR